ncbi:MAG TPA: YfbR-like 5'-deoxynucleotidase [Candidatus Paceibacterota bacterium]|nr:YfbR-like 5'-deoxynucleotidase [Candidatus Paceibacterota bacterium]
MQFREIDLRIFPGERKEELENIYRYSYFDTVLYRSNLWMHSHRVLWLLEELVPMAQKYLNFDIEKARVLALVHDDAEMVTGDVQAIVKARMSPEELQRLEAEEMEAVEKLVRGYPKEVNGYSYEALLGHAAKKDCIEARLVSYVDKLDAYCESLHEVYAGNVSLLRSVLFYANLLPLFPMKYPELKELLSSKESSLTYLTDQIDPFNIEAQRYTRLLKPHTKESLRINNDFPFYKTWKDLIIARGETDWLLKQKESLPISSN